MECVDKIRDTATSHDRLFFVEVMGRDAGFLALNGAIASGAEAAIIPEISLEKDQLATRMGVAAIDALLDDQRNVMMGIQNDQIVYVPFSKAIKNDKPINRDLLNTLRVSSI